MIEQQPDDILSACDPAEMPLVAALLSFAHSGRHSWHMPGHLSGQAWPMWLKSELAAIDVTELLLTDDINKPTGPAYQAMNLAAASFGAGKTRFITNGSTTALHILLASVVGRNGRLLLPRCSHQSVVHAAALLDLNISWLPAGGFPDTDNQQPVPRLSLMPQVTVEDVERALRQSPDCKAILITSPDYYGCCADLRPIARIAHEHGMLLLVDEAHGAHLAYGAGLLPESAMAAGADACVQSGHKTLPVLTQGAYLHLSADAIASGRLDADCLDRMASVFQTSSPSFPIAATLDYARACMDRFGKSAISRQLTAVMDFAGKLPRELMCQVTTGTAISQDIGCRKITRDPLRLIITSRDIHAADMIGTIAARLSEAGIDYEFTDLTRLVFIPSLWQTEQSWQYLLSNLVQTVKSANLCSGSGDQIIRLETEWRHWLQQPPRVGLPAGDALLTRQAVKRLPLREAGGRISARALLPYPPGIPLIWPGEIIDQNRVDFLRQLIENKINISGIDQENLLVLA